MKLTELKESVTNLADMRPKPNQLAKNNLSKFEFKVGDHVRNVDRGDTTGTIVGVYFMHEKADVHFGSFKDLLKNDDDVSTYDDYIEVMKSEFDPFEKWYSVKWSEDGFVGQQPEGTLRLTPKRGLAAVK